VNLSMDVLGDNHRELVDVRDVLPLEPLRQIRCLGKNVVPNVAPWRELRDLRNWRLGIEVTVESEGEDGSGVPRPAAPPPPPARRAWRSRPGDASTSSARGEKHLSRHHLPANEEAALVRVFLAEENEGSRVLTSLLP
jgi:hypothetical protein